MTSTRAAVIRRVESGRLTPKIAEQLAQRKRRFIGLLAHEPPPDKFDPIQETYWTLAMVLAWLIWRTPERVREFWNDWRLGKYVWEPASDCSGKQTGGYVLTRLAAVDLHDVWREDPAVQKNAPRNMPQFQRDLWSKLQVGELSATGIPYGGLQPVRVSIPKEDWIDLSSVYSEPGNEDGVCDHSGLLRYRGVRIASQNVIKFWPASTTGVAATTSHSDGGQHKREDKTHTIPKVQQRILDIADRKWPDGVLPPVVKDRDRMILEEWRLEIGKKKPSTKTIARAFAQRTKMDN